MKVELRECAECGRKFRPCTTKVNGAVSYKRIWCSPECYMASMAKMTDPEPIIEPQSIMVDETEAAEMLAAEPAPSAVKSPRRKKTVEAPDAENA